MAEVDCRYMGALQSYTITYPDPDETLLGTPEALPTSEPATAQIEYTIAAGHLPTVSPAGLEYTLTAILYAAGKNTDAASQTVYYRILKNGASVATGSASVAANTFYTWNHYNFLGVVAGDVLACKLWASSANVNWDYKALAILLTRPGPSNRATTSVAYSIAVRPVLTGGNPSIRTIAAFYPQHDDVDSNYITADGSRRLMLSGPTYRLGRVDYSDKNLSSWIYTSATYRPYYLQGRVPTAISFRPLTIRV